LNAPPAGPRLLWLAAISLALLALRLVAATSVGFGDSEALYACYALHPQAAYLDHPGLVGLLARGIGAGHAPSPLVAHVVTSVLATALPWLAAAAARAAGATWAAALSAGVAIAVVPEIAVGLFALTPDLLLAFGWLGALGLSAAALRAPANSARATACFLGAGLAAGVASAAKVSALTLIAALAVVYATRPARPHARTVWPWAGLLAGIVVLLPVAMFEADHGWPMLRHRLVDTQEDAGFSLRNLAAVPLGQLAYLSPLMVVAAVFVARDVWKRRHDGDPVTALLGITFLVPLATLLPLCLWSRSAEPHWLAPAFLSLALHAARHAPVLGRRFAIACVATSMSLVLALHAWVLVPALAQVVPDSAYDPRYDLANELYGWPDAVERVRKVAEAEATSTYQRGDIIAVGPHWTVCAQLHAHLQKFIPVGCDTPIPDDFDDWLSRERWRAADVLLFVTDNRFDVDVREAFPNRVVTKERVIDVKRGGRVVREFKIRVLKREAAG
jgi:hypothetical protein